MKPTTFLDDEGQDGGEVGRNRNHIPPSRTGISQSLRRLRRRRPFNAETEQTGLRGKVFFRLNIEGARLGETGVHKICEVTG